MDVGAEIIVGLFILAVAPGLFWMLYFYQKDRCEPEPLALIVRTFIFGIIVTLPVAAVENFFALFLIPVLMAPLIAPVVEETGKFLVVRETVYPNPEFNQPMDGIIYATAASLGFATLENILFVFSSLSQSVELAIGTGVVRAVLSVPGHALFSIMWGYSLGQAKFLPLNRRTNVIAGGLLLAMIFHGLFNLLLITNVGFALVVLVLVPLMWWMVIERIHEALGICKRKEQ